MEILNATGLLDFTLDDDAEEDEALKTNFRNGSASSLTAAAEAEAEGSGLIPELAEEDLEWISNKDAFPSVDTCFGILSENLELILNHNSPVSVLENGGTTTAVAGFLRFPGSFPVRPRSKSLRKKRTTGFGQLSSQRVWLPASTRSTSSRTSMGRRCSHCQTDETPQWRAGPMGPKTLCNACGVRYKSGRLVPEYRPANSPTFSSVLHSNSHRKVVEMRRKKYLVTLEENGTKVRMMHG